MEPNFWHERWSNGEIGFHQQDFNKYMQLFMDRLDILRGGHILVPLCGKSFDMMWLLEQGYRVTGIEISRLAVEDFFAENNISYQVINSPGMRLYRNDNLTIYCADIFTVELNHSPVTDAVYDRASLIALPQDMRPAYVKKLTSLLSEGTRSLLLTLEYPQQEMAGPPFSVTPFEVDQLFSDHYDIELLHTEDCLANQPRFREKGLTSLVEHTFLLNKRAARSYDTRL